MTGQSAILAFPFMLAFPFSALAQETVDQLGKALNAIERQNRGCEVVLNSYGHIFEKGGQRGPNSIAAVLVYSLSGCGGGNNWSVEVSVQRVSDNGLVPLQGLREHTFGNVDSASFSADTATLGVDTYAEGDAHCCPSVRRTAKVTFQGNIVTIAFSNARKIIDQQ